MVDQHGGAHTQTGKCNCSTSVMGLRVSSPSSAVLQRVTSSPWSYLDVQHRSADTSADRRVDGTNAALSAARRGQAPQPHSGAPKAQGLTAALLAETQ